MNTKFKPLSTSFKISAIYFVGGVSWILLSDLLVHSVGKWPLQITGLQSFKGLLFITCTALLLFGIVQYFIGQLDENYRIYHRATSTVQDGIFHLNKEGEILYSNEVGARIFGYSTREMVGKKISDFTASFPSFVEGKEGGYFPADQEACEEGEIFRWEGVGYRKDKEKFPIEFSTTPFFREKEIKDSFQICVIRDISRRKQMEREILEISEREKKRMGQDIHDSLGAQLAGIECMIKILEKKVEKKGEIPLEKIREIRNLIQETMEIADKISQGLFPVLIEGYSLKEVLEELLRQTEKIYGVECKLEGDSPGIDMDDCQKSQIYRIAQEAVRNAVKNGEAKEIKVALSENKRGNQVLKIIDNGRGFDDEEETRGLGLFTMKYRANMIHGNLTVDSEKERGTEVICSFTPLEKHKTKEVFQEQIYRALQNRRSLSKKAFQESEEEDEISRPER